MGVLTRFFAPASGGRIQLILTVGLVLTLMLGSGCGTIHSHRLEMDAVAEQDLPKNLSGQLVDPFGSPGRRGIVLIFLRSDCPIANHYAPEIRRLCEKYTSEGFVLWLVYADGDVTQEDILQHQKEYELPGNVLRDLGHVLVRRAGATVTPQAAVFLPNGKRVYCGRIDDRYVDFGKERPKPTERDLDDALQAVISGRSVLHPTTAAVGCYIPAPTPKR